MLRSVVLELTPPAERRATHRALAAQLDPERDLEARAWHLAEAAVGPEPAVAAALEAAAARAAARTGYAVAARLFERAAAFAGGPTGPAPTWWPPPRCGSRPATPRVRRRWWSASGPPARTGRCARRRPTCWAS